MFRKIAVILALTGLLVVAQDKPAAAPARRAASTAPASPVDSVIKLLKSGMSESLILKTVQKQKPYTPTADEMVKLKEAGASDNLIGAIIDPSSASAPAVPAPAAANVALAPAAVKAPVAPPAAPPTAAPVSTAAADCPAPAAISAAANAAKRRLAVSPFDYSAVRTNVTAMFGNDMNIGEGIRAMLGVKMAQSKNVVLLEREKIKAVMAEQDFGATNRVKQGSQAKIGKITGADAMLFGDIVIFGRDDKTKRNNVGGAVGSFFGGRVGAAMANSWTADKAVVAINLRIVDAETGETLDAAEARGESTRTSTNWAGMASGWKYGTGGAAAGAGQSMTSSNFAETIIGEATQDAVNKIAAILDQKVPAISAKTRTIEGRVASMDGCTLYLSVGGNDGVQVGDHFEIHQILKEVLDPETKEVLDKQTVKVGDFVVSTVRDKVSIGQYGGQPLSTAALGTAKGYAARLVLK